MFWKRTEPPLLNKKIRSIVLIGALLIFASPFIDEWAAYLEGKELKPFLDYEINLDLLWFVLVLCLFFIALVSRSLLGRIPIMLRILIAFGILVGSPIYYFTISNHFCEAPATMYLRGMADAAKNKVNLVALQTWAAETIREQPPTMLTNSVQNPAKLDWNNLPSDARAFLGGSNNWALLTSKPDGQNYIEASGLNDKVLVLAVPDSTNELWECKLAPGVYLEHRIRD